MKIEAAEVCLPCVDLAATLAWFVDELGFRLESIMPADDPTEAVIAGHGLRLGLERVAGPIEPGAAGRLRLRCQDLDEARELVAPNGTVVALAPADAALDIPPLAPRFELARRDAASWHRGRAGMRYRDLIPSRQGGRFIASHIHIPTGGPVPDAVHYHRVRVQLLLCYRGWVRVVYEDQGPAFVLEPGDCVLQPPSIRHRVLDSSDGFEIVEFGCPAAHPTYLDHALALPNSRVDPERRFEGQRFVRDRAAGARWQPDGLAGFAVRELGIAAATAGLAAAAILRAGEDAGARVSLSHDGELRFGFVLDGRATLELDGAAHPLAAADAFVVPPARGATLVASPGFELFEVRVRG